MISSNVTWKTTSIPPIVVNQLANNACADTANNNYDEMLMYFKVLRVSNPVA